MASGWKGDEGGLRRRVEVDSDNYVVGSVAPDGDRWRVQVEVGEDGDVDDILFTYAEDAERAVAMADAAMEVAIADLTEEPEELD